MLQVTNSTKEVTPFGGINFVYHAIEKFGLPDFLDKELGYRSVFAKYTHSDVVLSLFAGSLIQGSCLSDLEIVKEKLAGQQFSPIPSPDTVEYVCQKLKKKNVVKTTVDGVVHQLNHDNGLNEVLVKLAGKCNLLKPTDSQGYTLDYDNVVIENEKQDACFSYKKSKAYHPGFAFIGRIPVHIENRNGNTPASYGQKEILERCLGNLNKEKIPVAAFRGDNASYQKEVIELMDEKGIRFYIRMLDFKGIRETFAGLKDWQSIRINEHKKEVCSTPYSFKGLDKEYRVVVTRTLQKGNQLDAFEGRKYHFQAIITNDQSMSEKEVIEFYNQRGDSEKSNCYLLNDFNLNHLPFMDMDTNTVYMYLMAMCATLFEWLKRVLVANKTPGISVTMRAKAVCFRYIAVSAQWISHAHNSILKVFSKQQYSQLQI
jgi:hypothetical protein